MDGPHSGLYRISPSPIGPGVGAHKFNGAPERPIVFEGADQVWQVEEFAPGLYRLTLEGGWYSGDSDRKIMVDIRVAPGETWRIHRSGNSAFFIIEKDSRALPRLLWTLFGRIPGEQVSLHEPKEHHEFQQWYFERIHRHDEEA